MHLVSLAKPGLTTQGLADFSIPGLVPVARFLQSNEIAYLRHMTGSDHIRTISRVNMLLRSMCAMAICQYTNNVTLSGYIPMVQIHVY